MARTRSSSKSTTDSLVAIASGILVRIAASFIFGDNIKVAAIVTGLWDGTVLQRSLRRTKWRSTDPYFQPAILIFIDLVTTRNAIRAVVTALGCVLGVLLADIGPDLWSEIHAGWDGLDVAGAWNLVSRLVARKGSRQGNANQHPPRSSASAVSGASRVSGSSVLSAGSGSTTPLPSVVTIGLVSSLPDLPGSFQRRRPITERRTNDRDDNDEGNEPTPRAKVTESLLDLEDVPHMDLDALDETFNFDEHARTSHIPDLFSTEPCDPSSSMYPPDLSKINAHIGNDEPEPEPFNPSNPFLVDMDTAGDEAGPSRSSATIISRGVDGMQDDDYESVISVTSDIQQRAKTALYQEAEGLRRQAEVELKRYHALEAERKQAVKDGDHHKAFALKLDRDDAYASSQKLHEKAERRYYRVFNAKEDPSKIDVHGLKVPEAIKRTEKKLREVQLSGGKNLKVIVGQGHHSAGKVPVLKLAVLKAISSQKLPIEIDGRNPGVLNITIV